MTTQLSKTEVVNDNNEVVISYLTTEEKIHALQSLGKEWFSSIKNENDIYLQRGRILREIINEKLYKLKFNKETGIYEEIENREFEDFLKEDSKAFFKRHKKLSLDSANRYQAFYLLCNRMLSHANLSEPVLLGQITPMTHLILDDLDKAEEVWKGALACKGDKEYPSTSDVEHAFMVHGPKKAVTLRVQHQKDKFYNQPRSKKEEVKEEPISFVEEPVTNKPEISFNELQKYDGSIDPSIKCKAIASSYHQAKESLSSFKFTLYNFIQENGIEALNELKNIDVGVYSINDLDNKIKVLEKDLIKIKLLLD
tara:strand:+ start:754 stop:1686 length:933 start_codon:yes stop_codon:yes gene_type:complete